MTESKTTDASLIRQNEPLDGEEMHKRVRAFDQPAWYLTNFAANIRIRSETIVSMVDLPLHANILDIGCGDGSLSLPLLKNCKQLTLLDRSRAMLEIAGSRVSTGLVQEIELVNTDFMHAALSERSFDLILCVGVLAYVERRSEFIGKIKALLKPGGSVIIECTDVDHFVSRLVLGFASLRRLFGPSPMNTVLGSSKEIKSIFSRLGFTLCQSYRYSLPLPLLRRLMPQWLRYRAIRIIFGEVKRDRNARWGNECIFHFTLP